MSIRHGEFGEATATTWRGPAGQIGGLLVSLLVAYAAAWLGTLATTPNIPTWYAALDKPWFNPPNWVFPVAWGILYTLMAVAAWLVWREPKAGSERRAALVAYVVQLAINVGWSFAFFGAHNPPLGLAVIVVLLGAIVWTVLAFRKVSGLAAGLMVPYAAWVTFATILNTSILVMNL